MKRRTGININTEAALKTRVNREVETETEMESKMETKIERR